MKDLKDIRESFENEDLETFRQDQVIQKLSIAKKSSLKKPKDRSIEAI